MRNKYYTNGHFTTNFFKRVIAFILLTGILSGALEPIRAQTKRPATKTARTIPGKTASTLATPRRETPPLSSEPANAALSQYWQSGELPAALPLPAGNTDEVAAILAQKVAAKNQESVPALLTAVQLAGFFVTGKNGQVALAPPDGKGQGLAINGWEIAAAAKMFGEGRETTVRDLNERFKSIPQMRGAAAGSLLLDGARANAENVQNPYLRLWARFILELGKARAANGDQSAPFAPTTAKPEEIRLDAIQHLLLLRRLYGDLWTQTERYKAIIGANRRGEIAPPEAPRARFVNASFAPDLPDRRSVFPVNSADLAPAAPNFNSLAGNDTPPSQIPCRMDGNAPTIMDASAAGIGFGYGQFMNWLEDVYENTPTETAIKKFGTYQLLANVVLAYAKLVQTYASLETKITLEEGAPLVRTMNAAPGELKNLRAEVRMNIGNWQMYNCVRTMMNLTGIDFSTLNDGPLPDVGVTWKLSQGSDRDYYSNGTGINPQGEQIVGFNRNGRHIQDTGVGAGSEENANYTKTDERGVARIGLEGSPQEDYKDPYRAYEVGKQARVYTIVRTKAGDIKGDSVDVLSQALGGLPGLWTMPAELFYRTDWAVTAALTVPVTDWEECRGKGWSGTISITRRRSKDFTTTVNPGEMVVWKSAYSVTRMRDSFDYTGTIVVKNSPAESNRSTGASNPPVSSSSVLLKGETTVTAQRKNRLDEKKTNPDPSPCKGGAKRPISIETVSDSVTEGSVSGIEALGDLQIDHQTKRYNFRIGIPPIAAVLKTTGFTRTEGYCTPERNKTIPSDGEASSSFEAQPISGEGALDPKNPNLIEGSKTVTTESGETIVVRWSLRNCR